MSFVNRIVSILLLLVLAACGGGGGGAGTCTFGGCSGGSGGGGSTGSTPAASDLVLVLSANNVANNGTESVVATATAIDANRNTVAGVPVTISVDNGAVATPSGTKTDTTGTVSATVGIGSDRTARTVTVTAVSGGITKTASLAVVASTGGGGTDPSDLLLQLSSTTIANSGLQTVTATVTALDAKRNVLPGVVTSITANQGATVAPSGTTTAANGTVTALIGIGTDLSNRQISVTATAGGLTKVVTLDVVASPVQSTQAADLTLALSAATLDNGGTNKITATATAVNAARNTVPGIPISFTVDQASKATVTPSGTLTNNLGVVTADVGIGSDRSNRVITVTASSGTLTRSVSFLVTGATLTATFSPLVDSATTAIPVEFKLVDTNANVMPNQPITVSGTGLPSATGITDANGKFTYTYTAPSVTANTTINITASAAGDTETVAVTVQPAGGGSVPVATQSPQSASLTPSPSVISVNQVASTSNQVELRALFLGPNNQPVKNIRVRFDLAGNTNNTDGTVSWLGGNYSYSDVTGVARGTFTPGQRSSPTNGVTVRACYAINDFDTSTCPNAVTNTLTVTSEALSVNIRTNELVAEGAAKLTYIKQFVVMVVDAAGQAKSDVLITPSVDLPAYYKGDYAWNGKVWAQRMWLASSENWSWNPTTRAWVQGAPTTQPACPNEDVNRNGVREAGAVTPGGAAPGVASREEDLNWNGELDPRKADVAIKMVGSAKTDASGLAIVQIEYGKNLASWVDFVITVTASGISGSEARARYVGSLYGGLNLPFPAEAVTTETSAPAFVVSPYGKGYTGTTPSATGVCTNTN